MSQLHLDPLVINFKSVRVLFDSSLFNNFLLIACKNLFDIAIANLVATLIHVSVLLIKSLIYKLQSTSIKTNALEWPRANLYNFLFECKECYV